MGEIMLIVEDDSKISEILKSALKAKGYEVHVVSNGGEALQYLEDESKAKGLKLVILDRLLGDMDGVETIKTFDEKCGKDLPILILSTLSSEKDMLEGLRRGAVEYLTKPFNMDILLEKVKKLTG